MRGQRLINWHKIMNTTSNNIPSFKEVVKYNENVVKVCNEKIEHLTHPEIYGCCISKCNSIVINKERMMCVTTDKTNRTTYEFSPLYPTFFSSEIAKDIVKNDIYSDINDNRIKMEIVGELEYYRLLKAQSEKHLETIKKYGLA